MQEPDDIALMERFRSGDRAALEALVNRHHASLVRYFYVQCRRRETAEDLAQEVWARIIRARASYTPRARFQTYLFHIARNLWIDRYRSQRSAPPMVSADAPVGGAEDGGSLVSLLPGGEAEPGDRAAEREEVERLRRAVEALPEPLRDVVEMGMIRGMRYEDVGRALEIPVGTVKSRVHAAVRRLREALGPRDPAEGDA